NPENKNEHTVFFIDSSFIEIKTSSANTITNPRKDSIAPGMFFTDHTKKFKSKPLNRYIFQRQGDIYNNEFENLTYDRLYELNTFKSIKVNFTKSDSTHINANYELVPLKRMANRL